MAAVFVSHADSGEVRAYHLDGQGSLTEVQRLVLGGQLMPMALSPDRNRLYVARRTAPLAVVTMAVEAGRLRVLGESPLPGSMAYLSTDRSGRWLFSASYPGNLVAVSPIDADGVAGAPHEVLPTPPHAHAIAAGPANDTVLATSLGGGVLLAYRFDASLGRLEPSGTVSPHEGASPRHFVFDAAARFVYLLNELDGAIDVLEVDGVPRPVQTLSSMPPGFAGTPWAADLHLAPDGKRLYSSDRRSSTLATFEVDQVSGRLTLSGHVATEQEPRGFRISVDGRYLVVAGQASNRLAVFALQSGDALPRQIGSIEAGLGPNWVEIVA